MSNKYKFNDPDALYFVTFATVGWIDVFTRKVYKDLLLDTFRHCITKKGLLIHAYVIMSNHVHMVVSRTGGPSLSDIMRDLKKYSSHRILQEINQNPHESRKNWMLYLFAKKTATIKFINYGSRIITPYNCTRIPPNLTKG